MFTRRQAIVALSAASCAGCSIQPLKPAEPGRGWVVSKGVRILGSAFSGRSVIETEAAFGIGSPFRIASITKLIVAMAIYEWAARRYLNLNETVSDILPNTHEGVTLSNLLSHRSGLKDPDVYWAEIETDIRTLFDKSDFTHKPDTYFRYANLNYGLAATVVEARLGERFDLLIWKWLTRQGLDAGLNWSGVSPRKRKKAAALYRKSDTGDWAPTVDAPSDIPLASPTYLGRDRVGLKTYQLASNGTLFSPQGGMRMSLGDLLRIGRQLQSNPTFNTPVWTNNGQNAETESNHFLSFGPANYIYSADASPIPGVPLVGHLGEAYGAYTGLFIVPGTELVFAFAQLGTAQEGLTMTGTTPNQSIEHQSLFDELAPTLRAHI
ncbi:MAG: serine hydrolase domain-containing protein [Litorimonas sp.]